MPASGAMQSSGLYYADAKLATHVELHVLFDHVEWDEANLSHATWHGVAAREIEEAIINADTARRNRRNRSGDLRFDAKTDAGREVVVIVTYDPFRRSIRPITAWENR